MSSVKSPFVLVFDVDGTIINSGGYINHSVVELFGLGIIARERGIVSAILILTNNVFVKTNPEGTQGHVMEWLTTTLVPRIIDYIVNHRYIEYKYRKTQSKIFNEASQIISDKYPNKNVKNIMNNNETTKRMFSYKIFDEIFDKRARQLSNLEKDIKSMDAVSVMLRKAHKNVSNIRQRVFFINDDETHQIRNEMNGNVMEKKTQYIHIPEFRLSPEFRNNIAKGQTATSEKIHADLKNVSNKINSKPKMTELKRILKDKIREQKININNS